MSFQKTWALYWQLLHSEIQPNSEFPHLSPLLSHYTTMSNLERILSGEEVWLSNPLFMNDLEEVRFGVNAGFDLILKDSKIRSAFATESRAAQFFNAMRCCYDEYANEHVLDLYIMCFSVHDPDDHDGRLSMWRGYGQNGKGAALVFDTSKISVLDDSPLALAPVSYASSEGRIQMLRQKFSEVAEFISENDIPEEYIHEIANALFRRICLYAVFSKHAGFREENEWRLVYFKDRDVKNTLYQYFSYFNGPDGIQPKLKLPTKSIPGVIKEDFHLSDIVHSIIVGPSASSLLTLASLKRMLRAIGKPELIDRVRMSSIPYRET